MTAPERTPSRTRVAIVSPDPAERHALGESLRGSSEIDVLAWADSPESLIGLGSRVDVCLCSTEPAPEDVDRLRELGCAVVVDRGDPVAAVRDARTDAVPDGRRRPALSDRQRAVLAAYVSSSDLLPTVARRLGMDPETMKTHLRRIRAKYADAGRSAPTRRDLYVRAVEDGVLPPPSGRPRGH